jgi:hypothetical protein
MFHFFSCFSPLVVREEKENKKKYKRREKWVG